MASELPRQSATEFGKTMARVADLMTEAFRPLRESVERTARNLEAFHREQMRAQRMADVRRRAIRVRQRTEDARRNGGCW